jgi:hypothetical protein
VELPIVGGRGGGAICTYCTVSFSLQKPFKQETKAVSHRSGVTNKFPTEGSTYIKYQRRERSVTSLRDGKIVSARERIITSTREEESHPQKKEITITRRGSYTSTREEESHPRGKEESQPEEEGTLPQEEEESHP